ncbi:hypothetical protein [Maribellus sp. YY47]|uniref:hypothetical protein n=1 Tax=Maribellus sp. YY47 TaxID=2929486 RepID=UPI00200181A9|nr:hypothetical protein [Maribellus sp. YY47]MCK3682568.1 hypothetical protein [Maribellus sp. YY47]
MIPNNNPEEYFSGLRGPFDVDHLKIIASKFFSTQISKISGALRILEIKTEKQKCIDTQFKTESTGRLNERNAF